MSALVIADHCLDDLGFLAEALDEAGVSRHLVHRGQPGWPECADHELIVSLGSASSVLDPASEEARAPEMRLYRQALAGGTPVLAICYGAQVLARALGAPGRPAPRPQVGWITVDSAQPDLVPPGPWLAWHTDLLTVPAGALITARDAIGPQAFRYGSALAVQFHPELTPAEADRRLAAHASDLAAAGIDAQAVSSQAHHQEAVSRDLARALLRSFLARPDRAA